MRLSRYTALFSTLRDGSDDILVIANESNVLLSGCLPDEYEDRPQDAEDARQTWRRRAAGWPTATGPCAPPSPSRKARLRASTGGRRTTRNGSRSGEYHMRDAQVTPVAFDGDGSLIVASNVGRDTFALYRYDTEKKALGELLVAHPHVDLHGRRPHRPAQEQGRRRQRTTPNVLAPRGSTTTGPALQKTVDTVLPGSMNVITRGDAPRVLVFSYADTDPGTYYILDLEKRTLEFLASRAQGHQARGDAQTRARSLRGARRPRDSRVPHPAARQAWRKTFRSSSTCTADRGCAAAHWAWNDGGGVSRFAGLRGARARVSRQHRLGQQALRGRLEAVGTRNAGRPRRRRWTGSPSRAPSILSAHASWARAMAAMR